MLNDRIGMRNVESIILEFRQITSIGVNEHKWTVIFWQQRSWQIDNCYLYIVFFEIMLRDKAPMISCSPNVYYFDATVLF